MRELELPVRAWRGSPCGGGSAPAMLLPGQLLPRLGFSPGEEGGCTGALLRLQLPALLGETAIAFASTGPRRGSLQRAGCFGCLPASLFGQLRPRSLAYGRPRAPGAGAGLDTEGEVQAVISGS